MTLPGLTGFRSCNLCGVLYPATASYFDRDRQKALGLSYRCKTCKRLYFAAKGTGKANRWYYEPSKPKQNRKEYDRRYRENNREKLRAKDAAYAKTEAGKASRRAITARRRAAEAAAEGSYTVEEVLQMVEDQQGSCAYCETELNGEYHVDHMVPLTRGGPNDWSNLAVACAPCNWRKGTKTAEEFVATPA